MAHPGLPLAVNNPADMTPLRSLMTDDLVSHPELAILAQARSILHWHSSHGFCSNCGKPTAIQDAGYRRHCAACSTDHFPRTRPPW